ncbi:MAG: protein BatD [Bacteroidetes bacterium]|nr:protein BatD [Bacteroidota bacterium]
MKKNISIFLFIILAFNKCFSQVDAQVNSRSITNDQQLEYAIVIKTQANSYSPPAFKDFHVVSGPNQSTSMQMINGAVSYQLTLSWILIPKKEGKLIIEAASVVAGNQKFETKPITIDVSKGNSQQNQQNQNSNSGEEAKYGKLKGGEIFIRVGLSKTKCTLGEQVTITQKAYSRYPIVGFQKFNPPTYDGFYSTSQESQSKGQLGQENVDGIMYYTYELFRNICVANKAGKIKLTPISGEIIIRKQSNTKPKNFFEQFFGGGGYEDVPYSIKGSEASVEVINLPEQGKPSNFNGAVGDYTFKAEVSKNEVKANEAINLKLVVSGKGNLKLVNAPDFELPEGFEKYEPKVNEYANSKIFDFTLIPRVEGKFKLSNIGFSYFNLDSKKYNSIIAQPIEITVLKADPNSTNTQVYTPLNQVKDIENDIRYIKKGDFTLSKTESEFFNSFTHISILLLLILIFLLAVIFQRSVIKNNSNITLVKERKAAKVAKKQLIKASKYMKENNKDAFYTEILTSLNNYISNKLNIPIADLSQESIKQHLIQKGVDEALIHKFIEVLQISEYAKYAPGAVSGDLNKVYENTAGLISSIENQLAKYKA